MQQTLTAYTIYWDPQGTLSPGYRSLINRYFQDIGSSSFFNVASQYYQLPGPTYIQGVSTLGGTWIDTADYPDGRGTGANPLSDADIENEVVRALNANPGWNPAGLGRMYFVYTDLGVESCFDPAASYSNLYCTLGVVSPQANQYCAYHYWFGTSARPVIYANMPYGETWPGWCRNFGASPNGNIAADAEIQ